MLVIDTRHFEETVWGLGRGAPSGTQKHLIERYTLADSGMRLEVEYRFEDPEYMTEAVTATGEMFLKPGYEFEPWDCDSGAARRHLSVERGEKGLIQARWIRNTVDETTFVTSVALEHARKTIADHERTLLSAEDRPGPAANIN